MECFHGEERGFSPCHPTISPGRAVQGLSRAESLPPAIQTSLLWVFLGALALGRTFHSQQHPMTNRPSNSIDTHLPHDSIYTWLSSVWVTFCNLGSSYTPSLRVSWRLGLGSWWGRDLKAPSTLPTSVWEQQAQLNILPFLEQWWAATFWQLVGIRA